MDRDQRLHGRGAEDDPGGLGKAYGERAETRTRGHRVAVRPRRASTTGARSRRPAAKRIWHFVTAPIGRDASGDAAQTNAIDVGERRRFAEALAEKEARVRLAMDAANYGDWELDRASGRMVWSAQTRNLLASALTS
jgi:PAS domain-containing protein